MAKVRALEAVALLQRLHSLLSMAEEKHWVKRVDSVLSKIESAEVVNKNAKAEMKTWFGGMGSINDLVLSPFNGHRLNECDEVKLNQLLQEKLANLYEIVNSQ